MAQIVRNGGIKPFVRRSSGSKIEVGKPKGVSVGDNMPGGEREEDDKKKGQPGGLGFLSRSWRDMADGCIVFPCEQNLQLCSKFLLVRAACVLAWALGSGISPLAGMANSTPSCRWCSCEQCCQVLRAAEPWPS